MSDSVKEYFVELPHREAIDRACCNFARMYGDTELGLPAVLSTWDGHGKLRDGIEKRASAEEWLFSCEVSSYSNGTHAARLFAQRAEFVRRGFGIADTLPKAFALAVVELARQFDDAAVID